MIKQKRRTFGKFECSKSSVFAFVDENSGDCRDVLKWLPRITGKMSILEICP